MKRSFKPIVVLLETRLCPSTVAYNETDGILTFTAYAGEANNLTIARADVEENNVVVRYVVIQDSMDVIIDFDPDVFLGNQGEPGGAVSLRDKTINRIVVDLGDNNDYCGLQYGYKASIQGGEGDDVIEGHDGDDVLKGGNGKDTIRGGAGIDSISGEGDDDYLDGGDNSDLI